MIITVNGETIDYTLEDEKILGDVLTGLATWLEKSGMLISAVSLDGEAAPLSESAWKGRDIHTVGEVTVEALTLRESRNVQLETARDYFILLARALESSDGDSLKELADTYPDLRRILPHLLNEGLNPVILPRIDSVFTEAGFPPTGTSDEPDADLLRRESAVLANILENRRLEIVHPGEKASAAAEVLAAEADRLDDVAVQLQTGKDRAAMETIVRLTELLQALMRSLTWIPENETINALADDLTAILGELEEALKAGDTVLIGDLLEYEIKPRLMDLPAKLKGEAVS